MLTIDVRLTVEEAIFLMRAVAAKRRTELDDSVRDDLELLRLRLYDSVYSRQPEPIKINHWKSRKLDVQRAHDPHPVSWQTGTAAPPAAA